MSLRNNSQDTTSEVLFAISHSVLIRWNCTYDCCCDSIGNDKATMCKSYPHIRSLFNIARACEHSPEFHVLLKF